MARRVAASGLAHVFLAGTLMTALVLTFAWPLLHLFGARGETLDIAHRYVMITAPANLIFGLGMALSGILRAVGDARRAMYVTLSGAVITAMVDPLLIFGLGFGIYGAALSTVISRLIFLGVGYHGAVRVHRLVGRPRLSTTFNDSRLLMRVAVPAIMTNLATPVGNAYALHIYAGFGDAAVAASAMIDRIVYVAFAVVFALTGAVGPIIGQNLGARRFDRVRQTLTHCFLVTGLYSLVTWALLALAAPLLARLFHTSGETADYLDFFCKFGVSAWVFVGFLFVANAAFNNLGRPTLAMVFNWGRASLGTIPFVTLGAAWGGVKGAQLGIVVGAALFGLGALVSAYRVAEKVARRSPDDPC